MAHIRITYRGFYDIPRTFVTKWRNKLLLFDGHFDENLDDYPDNYSVYELPPALEDRLRTESWENLADLGRFVGRVPVSDVSFDKTRRKTIDDSILRRPGLEWP